MPSSDVVSTAWQLTELEDALARLGMPGGIPRRIRVAIRRRRHLRLWLMLAALTTPVLLLAVGLGLWGFQGVAPEPELDRARPLWSLWAALFSWESLIQVASFVGFGLVGGMALTALTKWPASQTGLHTASGSLSLRTLYAARRYALVMEIARALVACAEAHGSGGERLAPRLRKVSRRLGAVTRALGTAHSQRGSIPLLSHRRRALKAHQRQVIAALHECETRLDSDPRPALEDLGERLLTVADRYCQGRVGALLDEAQLQGVTAGRDREWVRIVIWAVLTAGGVVGVSFAGLSDGAEPIVMTLVGVFAGAVVFRRNVLRFFDLISLVGGGP